MKRSRLLAPRARVLVAACAFLTLGSVACSSSDTIKDGPAVEQAGPDGGTEGPPARERPEGPAAKISEPITGGNGPFIGAATGLTVPDGYVEEEFVASGTATSYAAKDPLTDDGKWTFEESASAAYSTRVLVRRPASPADSSRVVIVEWLNVSGGLDANPEYASLAEEITRQGHTWVGVSAQLIGIAGGPVLVKVPGTENLVGTGLRKIDPARYDSLSHPGDGYSFDIFTQVARAVLNGDLLGGKKPQYVLAAGESQSAIALTTYYDGVQPLTLAFDGFLVHSRASVALPLVGDGKYADLTGAIGSAAHPVFRDDVDAPVLELQAESDVTGVLNSGLARQPDGDRFRLWEVAGTSHADVHLIGSVSSGIDCGVPINDGPMHIVAKAALHGLDAWVRAGTAPATAARLELSTDAVPAVKRDADGIVLGGIRTPPVDVPVDVLSGVPGPNTDLLCLLLGSTKPLPDDRLTALYSSRADYQSKYDASTDATIEAGFALAPDRAALEAFAQPSRVSP